MNEKLKVLPETKVAVQKIPQPRTRNLELRTIPHEKKYKAYVVSHTHWDREWYFPFERYRLRLVRMLDETFQTLRSVKGYKSFTLDGYTAALEDYLEIRPESEGKIKKLVQQGKLHVGPWYVLADEWLSSGEALIRNLLVGTRIAESFGKCMRVGYVPDPFGHISQLPQILQGFAIRSFLFARGMGDEGETLGSEFIWKAPDQHSRVLAVHLVGHYDNFGRMGYPVLYGWVPGKYDFDLARERFKKLLPEITRHARTSLLLLCNGGDHHGPQKDLPQVLKVLQKEFPNIQFHHASFEEYLSALEKISRNKLVEHQGEFRGSRYAPIIPGVASTHLEVKNENEKALKALERYAEPLSALVSLMCPEYVPLRSVLEKAWKYVLLSHAHDSLSACSDDEVVEEVLVRLKKGRQVAEGVMEEALNALGFYAPQPASLLEYVETPQQGRVAIYNPSGRKRSDLCVMSIPGPWLKAWGMDLPLSVTDNAGFEVPVQRLSETTEAVELVFPVEGVPPLGVKEFTLKHHAAPLPETHLKAGARGVENQWVRLEVYEDGSVSLFHKELGISCDPLLMLEDQEDAGDSYNWSPAENSQTLSSRGLPASIRVVHAGPWMSQLEVRKTLDLPLGLEAHGKSRSLEKIPTEFVSLITLRADSPRVDVEIRWENRVKDHRVRAVIASPWKEGKIYAETPFDVVERPACYKPKAPWREPPTPTWQQKRFVSLVSSERVGMTVFNEALPEYEVRQVGERRQEIALTLLRCVGLISRRSLPTRSHQAGPLLEIPGAQMQGPWTARYSVLLHKGDPIEARVWEEAERFVWPFLTGIGQNVPSRISLGGISLVSQVQPESVTISALKRAQDQENIILRLFNYHSRSVPAKVTLSKVPRSIYQTDLNEKRVKHLVFKKTDSEALFTSIMGPKEISTFELVYDG
ncbi:MAG: hypothetical protein HY399_06490 [Elusimicrobia bacterium]|nr:hypothetical protein [Elusimicrobiota bacterium]